MHACASVSACNCSRIYCACMHVRLCQRANAFVCLLHVCMSVCCGCAMRACLKSFIADA